MRLAFPALQRLLLKSSSSLFILQLL